MALAWRSSMSTAETLRVALGPGPDAGSFPPDVLAREEEDLAGLRDLGVRLLTIADPDFPDRLREDGPVVLQVAGRADLLSAEGVTVLAGHKRLGETLDAGDRAVIVLSKGMLKARTLLRALHEQIEEGTVTSVTAEPPVAHRSPGGARRRDVLVQALKP